MNPPFRAPDQVRQQLDRLFVSAEARKIVEFGKNDRTPAKNFTEAISADPLFAARLVRLASFAPGLAQRLSTVPQLVNVWGLDNLKPLALGLSAFALRSAPPPRDVFVADGSVIAMRELWEHALGTAAIAGRLAARDKRVSPLRAFTAGFIHDIGKVFLCRLAQQSYSDAIAIAREKWIPSTEAETLALGTDHVSAGAQWGMKCELPHYLEQVLRFHHERLDTLPVTVDDDTRRLLAITQTADSASEIVAVGNGGDRAAFSQDPSRASELEPDNGSAELRALKDEVEALRPIFGFPKRDIQKTGFARSPRQAIEQRPAAQQKATASGPRGVVIPFPSRVDDDTGGGAKPAPGKLAILVVEDHSSLCDLLSLYFMRHGYHVRTASDGQSALDVLSREQIHLVLLDLMLPRIDGFEVLRQIHRTHEDKTPYVIVVSAGASERDRKKVLDLGANEYMPKPFHLLRLLERVQTVEKFLL